MGWGGEVGGEGGGWGGRGWGGGWGGEEGGEGGGGVIGSQKGMHPTWGEGCGVGRGRDGRVVAEGYAPCLGVGYCRKVVFEGLSRGVRGDALACRGHPYMFYNKKILVTG